uniref:BclA C-terminal domain-containing protein n=1 Tax=Siphoviridae sp. ctD2Q91 TaxID=2825383 RepID=A0A8S5PN29_9CAUD|nr:MAG TPA: hypothetical protein [Siphoviridae sp. ctD2Q91]
MSKSAIYTTNTSAPTVPVGGIVPVGSTARRFGCNIRQDGNAITLCGQGYYLVNVSATVAPTAAGTVSLTAQKDGVPIIGAVASSTVAANGTTSLAITAIVRNACGCDGSLLSLALDGVASVVNNLAVTVEKL